MKRPGILTQDVAVTAKVLAAGAGLLATVSVGIALVVSLGGAHIDGLAPQLRSGAQTVFTDLAAPPSVPVVTVALASVARAGAIAATRAPSPLPPPAASKPPTLPVPVPRDTPPVTQPLPASSPSGIPATAPVTDAARPVVQQVTTVVGGVLGGLLGH